MLGEATRKAIFKSGITTIEQLLQLTRDELDSIPSIGPKTIDVIRWCLEQAGHNTDHLLPPAQEPENGQNLFWTDQHTDRTHNPAVA
jgi:hypothetical protein